MLIGIRMDWASYSTDLNPWNFFLVDYLMVTFYSKNPQTLEVSQNVYLLVMCLNFIRRIRTKDFELNPSIASYFGKKFGLIETIVQ